MILVRSICIGPACTPFIASSESKECTFQDVGVWFHIWTCLGPVSIAIFMRKYFCVWQRMYIFPLTTGVTIPPKAVTNC